MPDPPLMTAAPLLAAAPESGPWANDLFPAVLLLALGAGLVALGAWIVRPPPRPPHGGDRSGGGRKRSRGPRRDRPPRAASPPVPGPDPLRRPLR